MIPTKISRSIFALALTLTFCATALGCRTTKDDTAKLMGTSSSDSLAESLGGSWEHVNFISKRKEFETISLSPKGSYKAALVKGGSETGSWTASASDKSLTLVPASGSKKVYSVIVDSASEMQLILGAKPSAADAEDFTERFLLVEGAVEGPGDGPGHCSERKGGAFITFKIVGEEFKLWTFNQAFIKKAKDYQKSKAKKVPMFYPVADKSCPADIKVDPNKLEWADLAIEICDGTIKDGLEVLFKKPGYWCPWNTQVMKVEEK